MPLLHATDSVLCSVRCVLSLSTPSRDKMQVVSAFEGYAFDAGMRPGDTLLSVNGTPLEGLTVDAVRDLLRGSPDTEVAVQFTREGVNLDGKGVPKPQEVCVARILC